MKNFLLILLAAFCVMYCSGWQQEKEKNEMLRQCKEGYRQMNHEIQVRDSLVLEYRKSLPDSFLNEYSKNTGYLEMLDN